MTNYPKLVRDQIPKQISGRGAAAQVRIAPKDEMFAWLLKKAREEIQEFESKPSLEELADILEVLKALAETTGGNFDEVARICELKHKSNGGFEKGFILEGIIEPHAS